MERAQAAEWIDRWERQQTAYLAAREDRFRWIVWTIRAAGFARPRIVDLGCGPGSLSIRLLRGFAHARVTAVDHDPVLLHLGQSAFGDQAGRLRWVDTDLRRAGWSARLPDRPVDVVASTTALHWLSREELGQLYRECAGLLHPGGLLLNGDSLPFDRPETELRRLTHRLDHSVLGSPGAGESWTAWWEALGQVPQLRRLFAERRRRYPDVALHGHDTPLRDHADALRRAGFREIGTLWQQSENRLLVAVR